MISHFLTEQADRLDDFQRFPYTIKISNEEYNQYKKDYKKSSNWKIFNNGEISFRLITKFELCCVIKENELIFGFGNLDIIHP